MTTILRREFAQAKGDPRRFIFLFGAALAYLFVFGMLYMPNLVRCVPTVIYDAENSKISREITRGFFDSDSFDVAACVDSEEEMLALLREKEAFVAIEIPSDFSRKIVNEGSASVLYTVNGSNIIMTNVTSAAAQDILAAVSDKIAARRAALALGADEGLLLHRVSPVAVRLRVLANQTQGYMFFFLLGLAMAAFQQGIIFAVGAAVIHEYEHTEENIGPYRLLLGKVIFYQCFALLSFAVIVLAAEYLLQIPLRAPFWELAALGGAYAFGAIGFFSLAASLFRREVTFVRAAIMYPVPAFILSGYTWPHESMSEAVRYLAAFFPLSYLSNAVRDLFLSGVSPDYAKNILVLFIMGAICIAAALHSFGLRYEKARKG